MPRQDIDDLLVAHLPEVPVELSDRPEVLRNRDRDDVSVLPASSRSSNISSMVIRPGLVRDPPSIPPIPDATGFRRPC